MLFSKDTKSIRGLPQSLSHSYPSDSDAEYNSTQHPIWPRALSEESAHAVNDLWMRLTCFDVYECGGMYTNKFVTEPEHLKWTDIQVFSAWKNGLMEILENAVWRLCGAVTIQKCTGIVFSSHDSGVNFRKCNHWADLTGLTAAS